jgi:hypothetical protein
MFWQVKLAAAVGALALAFYMGKVWEQSSWQAKELKYLATIEEHKKQAEKVAYEYEIERASRAIEQREIIREVFVEVAKPVYSCQLPADGLRVINKAIASANAGKPSGTMRANPKR